VALGLSPVAAWVAADGELTSRLLAPIVLGAGVTTWVAGFDVLYACQDERFDREHGLHSIPARFGIARAMLASRVLHGAAIAAFAAFGTIAGLGIAYLAGVVVAAVLLVWQHRLLRPDDLSRIQTAFFTANGGVALGLFAAGCADLYLR
jgi:4-hydroxybenzoate polyprenyltransferase